MNVYWQRVGRSAAYMVVCLLFIVGLFACAPPPETTPSTPESSPTVPPTPTPSPEPSPTTIPTPTPLPSPTPGPLDSAEIYRRIAPSIAFIDTPSMSGSGILLADGYILTNAHVVWPGPSAQIVFSDGSRFDDVSVVDWNWLHDLAILGPIDTDLPPLSLVDGENRAIGSTVYLIGYPAEEEALPQPTITRGIISRMRESGVRDVSYFQTDTPIASGQSGGALVSDRGNVIGVSSYSFSSAGFALTASAGDIAPLVAELLAPDETPDKTVRGIHWHGDTRMVTTFRTNHMYDTATYAIHEPEGTLITLSTTGAEDMVLFVTDSFGTPICSRYIDETDSGELQFETEDDVPYFITLRQGRVGQTSSLFSSHPLHGVTDSDDGEFFHRPSELRVEGALDYPFDVDHYVMMLEAGDEAHIKVESIVADVMLDITYNGSYHLESISDDDSGGGFSGRDAELTLRAPVAGEYVIAVSGYEPFGGYILSVQPPGASSPPAVTPAVMANCVTPNAVATWAHVKMQTVTSADGMLVVTLPASWRINDAPNSLQTICDEDDLCLTDGDLLLVISPTNEIPRGFPLSLTFVAEMYLLEVAASDMVTVTHPLSTCFTVEGLEGHAFGLQDEAESLFVRQFIFGNASRIGSMTVYSETALTNQQEALLDYILGYVHLEE